MDEDPVLASLALELSHHAFGGLHPLCMPRQGALSGLGMVEGMALAWTAVGWLLAHR
eukprot:CAMPEP_0197661852 /NCGR_PEP_ID=MMETSP1338-20131121/51707_1 /TAXON_ID=43686 ORGANISM="Pelagodinium beii, Strain RCC1491" /NCGR_SAMPLE_ID=MMETSP1338 /ASSEMBLY_ACC=CAM_ASM_000754 /LENGTH=56 /DNA_ID=CAMNT_0043239489 /DNA_START=269 /DNA_END=439 /DNA_ORIENTATION=+